MSDISQSAYIFNQKILISIIVAIIAAALILVFIFRISKSNSNGNKPYGVSFNIYFILVTLVMYFVFFFPQLRNTLLLKQRAEVAEGKTLHWIDIGDGQRQVEFTYEVNGAVFKNQAEIIYGGQEIKDIVCPGGRYIVLYDRETPQNAIMDFRRPLR